MDQYFIKLPENSTLSFSTSALGFKLRLMSNFDNPVSRKYFEMTSSENTKNFYNNIIR